MASKHNPNEMAEFMAGCVLAVIGLLLFYPWLKDSL